MAKRALISRPVTRGRRGVEAPLENFSPPPEKMYWTHGLKLLDIVQKIWATLRNLFGPLVSQAGYGPAC